MYTLKILPVKYSCFFENISQVDVRIQEVGINSNSLHIQDKISTDDQNPPPTPQYQILKEVQKRNGQKQYF